MSKKKKIIISVIIIVAVAVVAAAIGAGVTFLILNKNENPVNNTITDNTLTNENTTNNTTTNNTITKNTTTNSTTKNNTITNSNIKNTTTNTTTKNTTTNTASSSTTKPTPYVQSVGLTVGSATQAYTNPVFFYTTDKTEDKNIIDVGCKFDTTSATHTFSDYSISSPDKNGNVVVSFKYSYVAPMKYTRTDYSYKDGYYYSTYYSDAVLFDYYTGEIYKYNEYSSTDDDKDYTYNDIVWNGKTTKVGVKAEKSSSWDGKQTVSENVYSDTWRLTLTYYVSIPKDYDGIILGILKEGTNQKNFDYRLNYLKKYDELKKQAETTGTKSKELTEFEEKRNNMIKLLEYSRYDIYAKATHTKNDFYVFKVKDISPVKK